MRHARPLRIRAERGLAFSSPVLGWDGSGGAAAWEWAACNMWACPALLESSNACAIPLQTVRCTDAEAFGGLFSTAFVPNDPSIWHAQRVETCWRRQWMTAGPGLVEPS